MPASSARSSPAIIGFAWSVATFLVVPVLVVEKVGPLDAIKRSASLLRKTWGEQLVGNFGIGLVFGLLVLLVVLLLGVGAVDRPHQRFCAAALAAVVFCRPALWR